MPAPCIALSSVVRFCRGSTRTLALVFLWLVGGDAFCQAQSHLELITTNTQWRFNQSGEDVGSGWASTSYDDRALHWEGPGRMLFGFETDEIEYLPFSFLTP